MKKAYQVLIVEDDEDDQLFLKTAFEKVSPDYQLQFAFDGQEALDWMTNPSKLPDLILLDLNMPRLSGLELLEELKGSPQYRHLPILVLTTSSNPEDIYRAYWLGANSYITKPNSHQRLAEITKQISQYWFKLTQRPVNSDQCQTL